MSGESVTFPSIDLVLLLSSYSSSAGQIRFTSTTPKTSKCIPLGIILLCNRTETWPVGGPSNGTKSHAVVNQAYSHTYINAQ